MTWDILCNGEIIQRDADCLLIRRSFGSVELEWEVRFIAGSHADAQDMLMQGIVHLLIGRQSIGAIVSEVSGQRVVCKGRGELPSAWMEMMKSDSMV